MTKHPAPPVLPEGAIGFIGQRHDRMERYALYRPDGTLSNTFAADLTAGDIAELTGLRVDPLHYQPIGTVAPHGMYYAVFAARVGA